MEIGQKKRPPVKHNQKNMLGRIKAKLSGYWRKGFWHKLLMILTAVVILITSGAYGISYWYKSKHANEPLTYGVTFIPNYARYLELDPKETMRAMIDDLGFRRFRLVSYWNNHEKERGSYDFSELDWQFEMAEQSGSKILLAVGLRQPRWPECHMPEWAHELSVPEWSASLKVYMTEVIERYKDSPALESYQLENEFLLEVFGECQDFNRDRLIDEFNLIKRLDPSRPVIVTRSNNAVPSWPVGEPRADMIGAAVYKRVWDNNITYRYFEYPFPPWFYGFLAGGAELTTGVNTFIHELQAEPWMPDGYALKTSSTEEQYKSMNPQMLKDRFKYARDTGIRTIDLWGAEWWYFRKVHRNDPSLWDIAREEVKNAHKY